MSTIEVLKLVVFDLGIVAGCDYDDEHEEYEDNHDVHATLICNVNLTRGAPPVNAAARLALRGCLAHIEIGLHALRADTLATGAVPE